METLAIFFLPIAIVGVPVLAVMLLGWTTAWLIHCVMQLFR